MGEVAGLSGGLWCGGQGRTGSDGVGRTGLDGRRPGPDASGHP